MKHLRHHARRHLRHPKTSTMLKRVVLGLGSVTVIALVAVFAQNALNQTTPILGLKLEDHVVGRLHANNFHTQTDTVIYEYEHMPISLRANGKANTVSFSQLGVRLNSPELYAQLLHTGRTGNVLADAATQISAVLGLQNVRLQPAKFNSDLAKKAVADLEKQFYIAPTNAEFIYKNQQVAIAADKAGEALDINKSVAALAEINPVHVSVLHLLPVQPGASITQSSLHSLLPQVKEIAAKSLTISAGDNKTVLTPDQLVALVSPKLVTDPKNKTKSAVQLSFNEQKLNGIIDDLLKRTVVSATPTIMSDGVVIKQGKPGVQANDPHILQDVLTALIERQTGVSEPDDVTIQLAATDPPIVQQTSGAGGVVNNRTGTGLVRLTFDDGPGAHTEQVLDILKQYGVHATFYVIGRNVERYPATMQRIVREGHTIGNHSYSHSNMTTLSAEGIRQEITSTQAAIQAAAGVTPTGFRPPGGFVNQTVRNVVGSLGMSLDMWSVDPRDWAQPGANAIIQRVLNADSAGSVVLLHVLYQQTIDALPAIINGIRAQGYTLE